MTSAVRPPRARAALLMLATVTALAALAAGCSSDAASPSAAVAEAATKTTDAGSARLVYTATLSGGQLGGFEMSGEGAFDYDANRGRMTYEMGPPLNARMQMIMDELVMYMRLPAELRTQLPAGKSWLKLDLGRIGKTMGVDLDALVQLNQGDPSQALNYLRGTSDEVEEVGEEEVRGVDTTHYRADVDLERALEQSLEAIPEDQHAAVRAAVQRMIELTGTRTLPMDVWVDDEGLARRIAMSTDMKVPEQQGERIRMQMQMEFFDFGVGVDVQPPAPDEVVDVTTLATRANGDGR
jgi:hypothetical protein